VIRYSPGPLLVCPLLILGQVSSVRLFYSNLTTELPMHLRMLPPPRSCVGSFAPSVFFPFLTSLFFSYGHRLDLRGPWSFFFRIGSFLVPCWSCLRFFSMHTGRALSWIFCPRSTLCGLFAQRTTRFEAGQRVFFLTAIF